MIQEEIVHINGHPKKIIVFLHGYQDCAGHIEHKIAPFFDLPDVAIHIPQSPFLCEIDANKRQWYSLHRFDPEDKRRSTTSWDEFLNLYNKMTLGLAEVNNCILTYVDNLLLSYGLSYEDLFLCGFSQGAMCALYTALMCPNKIAGVVSFSGIIAASGYIENHLLSKPDILLIHGEDDNKIPYKAQEFTAQELKKINCKVTTVSIPYVEHKISPEAILSAYNFIDKHIKRKAGRK